MHASTHATRTCAHARTHAHAHARTHALQIIVPESSNVFRATRAPWKPLTGAPHHSSAVCAASLEARARDRAKRVEAASASLRVPAMHRSAEDIANIHAAIVESEFLQRYSFAQLASLCRACELRELKPEETLFGEGDVGDHFFVLIKGTVDVYKEFLGQGRKCVATLHDSGSFGELALLRVSNNKQTNKRARSASRPCFA